MPCTTTDDANPAPEFPSLGDMVLIDASDIRVN